MKGYMINLVLTAVIVAITLAYYYGHSLVYHVMVNAPSLVRLSGR